MAEAPAQPMAAAPDGRNCDALYAEYKRSQTKEEQLFTVALLLVYATAVLLIVAVVMILFGGQNVKVASGGVALFSGSAAGAITTMYWRARRDTIDRMNAWIKACPDRIGPTLAAAI